MVEQALSSLDKYDLEIKGVRKGRGFWIVNCKNGDYVLKEYRGSQERVLLQKTLTTQIMEETGVVVQEIVPNKEGELISLDGDERKYMLQTYMEGRECNLKDDKDCALAVSTMAKMHKGMYINKLNAPDVLPYSLKHEFEKRNTELRRIRRYLKEKRQKNDFERFLHKHFNYFFEKALEVEEEWRAYEAFCVKESDELAFCHGDYQHHNVWMSYHDVMILQFEKFSADLPCRDLYLFMRKFLEKNNWDIETGREMLELYEKERELTCAERISMIYRFAYPEKFWKIANYYFNSKKSFMPEKNTEKLERLLEQDNDREKFISEILRKIV